MQETGFSRRELTALRNGHALPHAKTRDVLVRAAAAFAREELASMEINLPLGDAAACARFHFEVRRLATAEVS
jgi:hypothetical protein